MPLYSAQDRFTENDDSWLSYIEWSGRTDATEIITFDGMLCSSAIDDLTDEDWQYNVHADKLVYLFSEYEYLLKRIAFDPAKHNILEFTQRPDSNVIPTESFRFCGYDIMDSDDSISVLLNCGAFPGIFSPGDTNSFGLLDKLWNNSIDAPISVTSHGGTFVTPQQVYTGTDDFDGTAHNPMGETFVTFGKTDSTTQWGFSGSTAATTPHALYGISGVLTVSAVPEPSSFLMLAVVGAGVAAIRRRKRVRLVSK